MMVARAILAVAALWLGAGLAAARPVDCETWIAGTRVSAAYDTNDSVLRENSSYRERLFGGYGRITCPGQITLRVMTPGLSDLQREPFCLQYDRDAQTYTGFVVGDRDAYVGCRKPSKSFCQRVNAGRDSALAVARYGAGLVGRADPDASAAGLSAIARASGAVILSGPRQYLADNLVALGAKAAAVATAPGTLGASALTVVAVGGVLYACSG